MTVLQQSFNVLVMLQQRCSKVKKKKKYARMLLFIYYFVIDGFNYETYMYVSKVRRRDPSERVVTDFVVSNPRLSHFYRPTTHVVRQPQFSP